MELISYMLEGHSEQFSIMQISGMNYNFRGIALLEPDWKLVLKKF